MVMITDEGSTKIANFITTGVEVFVLRCGHISYIVKMNFFKKLFPYSQTNRGYSNDVQGRVHQNCKLFHESQGSVLVRGRGQLVNMQYFFSTSYLQYVMDRTN